MQGRHSCKVTVRWSRVGVQAEELGSRLRAKDRPTSSRGSGSQSTGVAGHPGGHSMYPEVLHLSTEAEETLCGL